MLSANKIEEILREFSTGWYWMGTSGWCELIIRVFHDYAGFKVIADDEEDNDDEGGGRRV